MSKNDSIINLEQLNAVTRGMADRERRYLEQFTQLCADRSSVLKDARSSEDRELIKKTIHSLRPQLLFFGVKDTKHELEKLQLQADNLSWSEIDDSLNQVLNQMDKAVVEVKSMLD